MVDAADRSLEREYWWSVGTSSLFVCLFVSFFAAGVLENLLVDAAE
jgi:hypothetical protein